MENKKNDKEVVSKNKKVVKKIDNKEIKKEKKTVNVKEGKVDNKKSEDIKVVKEEKKDKKRTTFNLLEVILIMIITALFGAFVGSSVVYFNTHKTSSVKLKNKDLEEFVTTYNGLLKEYYTDIDKEELLEAGIKGMIEYLGDPYSTFMDNDATSEFNQEVEGNFTGMGVEIQKQSDGGIKIVNVFENSPAEKSGFKVGDFILKVGDKDVTKMDVASVAKLIKGKAGTKVKITIKRDNKEKTIELTRESVDIPSVSSKVIEKSNKKIGYIRIEVFAKNTAEQFEKHLNKMKEANVSGLVLDVRGNSGGYLSVVTDIASHFLKNNQIVYRLDTKGVTKKIYASGSNKFDKEVAVLIDGGSASASEILASTLNENNNSSLVGTKSYGKGSVQKAVTLSNGSTIKYTIQTWLTAKGNSINKKGIEPTKKVELSKDYDGTDEKDNQLQEAIKLLVE